MSTATHTKVATCVDCGKFITRRRNGPAPQRCPECRVAHQAEYKRTWAALSRTGTKSKRGPQKRSRGVKPEFEGRYCQCGCGRKIYGPNRMYRPDCHARILRDGEYPEMAEHGGMRFESPSALGW